MAVGTSLQTSQQLFFLSKLVFLGNHSSILGAYLCLEDKDEGSKSVSELEHDAKV